MAIPDDTQSKASVVVGAFNPVRTHFPRTGGSIDRIRRLSIWAYAGIEIRDPFIGLIIKADRHRIRSTRKARPSRIMATPWFDPVLTVRRIGHLMQVAITSSIHLSMGSFHWYRDGAYIGSTGIPSRTFRLEAGEQARIDVIASSNPDFDPQSQQEASQPSSRRVLEWFRSLSPDAGNYIVKHATSADGESWTSATKIREIRHDDSRWGYRATTDILTDLTHYRWTVLPVDVVGNEGTASQTIGPEHIVRRPDAPDFTVSFDAGTSKVTFAAA